MQTFVENDISPRASDNNQLTPHSISMSNILKRKNEDEDSQVKDQLSKRPALDSEQLEISDKQQDTNQTAPSIYNPDDPDYLKEDYENVLEQLPSDSKEGDQAETVPKSHPAKPVYSARDKEDPNLNLVRMLCPVKEAGAIVGKKGEKISHLREKANVRIYISENLKNVPERVVTIKGSAENVARAFGLITRTILEEPEDEPALVTSKQYVMKLLVPHPMVGYLIGKGGLKFREIEEKSAAKLKASEQPMPFSTDRIVSVSGVGDAIHIALYFICQTMLEQRDNIKKHKVIFYNPANARHQLMGPGPMMNMPIGGPQHHQFMPHNAMPIHGLASGSAPGMKEMHGASGYQQKPYNFQMMFQPTVRPRYNNPPQSMATSVPLAPQNQFTDEHGNTIVGDVITNIPVQVSSNPDKFTQDVYVANINIGSVIGKGGNNIKQIREVSTCAYVKIEPDLNHSILLGGGRGLTNVRKLTLTGTYNAIQSAIFLINQRISLDKERNGV